MVLSGLVFFGWGEIFSLFPSTLTDSFGSKHATTNYGFLYMAQGVGSILGAPVAAMIFEKTASWMPVFALVIGMDILTGLLALFVLKPMRRAGAGKGNGVAKEFATSAHSERATSVYSRDGNPDLPNCTDSHWGKDWVPASAGTSGRRDLVLYQFSSNARTRNVHRVPPAAHVAPRSAATRCVTFGTPSVCKRLTASCRVWSAWVTRSCWRRCSIQESSRKVSTNRPTCAVSS